MEYLPVALTDLLKEEISLLQMIALGGFAIPYDPDNSICRSVERLGGERYGLVNYDCDVVPGTTTQRDGVIYTDENTRYTIAASLTRDGRLFLERFERESNQDAQDQKEKRFYHKTEILKLVIPILTFLAGVLLEYYAGVMEFLFQ